jgi:hypothetical protein
MTTNYLAKRSELQDREYSALHRWHELQDLDHELFLTHDTDYSRITDYVGARIKTLEQELKDVRAALADLDIADERGTL